MTTHNNTKEKGLLTKLITCNKFFCLKNGPIHLSYVILYQNIYENILANM
jgi:hypothetical protein